MDNKMFRGLWAQIRRLERENEDPKNQITVLESKTENIKLAEATA